MAALEDRRRRESAVDRLVLAIRTRLRPQDLDGCSVGDEDGPILPKRLGDRLARPSLENAVDQLQVAPVIDFGVDHQPLAQLDVERPEEVVEARRLGVAEHRQHRPASVGVRLQTRGFLGLERVLGTGHDDELDVVGDRVLQQVQRDDFVAVRRHPRLPDPDSLPVGAEVVEPRLAVAHGEGDLRRLPLANPDQGRGQGVLAVERRFEAVEARGARSGGGGANISWPPTATNLASFPSPYSIRTPPPINTAISGARLERSSARSSSR